MSMFKKDYKAIAAEITGCTLIKEPNRIAKDQLLNCLCEYFKQENMAFNEEKFREACYERQQDSELIRN